MIPKNENDVAADIETNVQKDSSMLVKLIKFEFSQSYINEPIGPAETIDCSGFLNAHYIAPSTVKIKYSSSNPSVATVDENGIVTGIQTGYTTITATVGERETSMFVTVANTEHYFQNNITVAYETSDLSFLLEDDKKVYDKIMEVLPLFTDENMSDMDRVRAVHDYIIENTSYDIKNYKSETLSPSDFSSYGVMINGEAVCQGYAETMGTFMTILGYPNLVVKGKGYGLSSDGVTNEWLPHAWNRVYVDGEWINIDVTFDDPIVSNADSEKVYGAYFNIPTAKLKQDHMWEETFE